MSMAGPRPDPIDALPPAQLAIAMRRARAVRLWDAALSLGKAAGRREPAVTAAVLPLLAGLGVPRCGRSTLFTWRRWYRADGLAGLADMRGVARTRWRRFGPFLLDVERVYTSRLIGLDVTHELVSQTAAHTGWVVPTLRETRQYVKRYILPGLTAERGGTFDGGSIRASDDI